MTLYVIKVEMKSRSVRTCKYKREPFCFFLGTSESPEGALLLAVVSSFEVSDESLPLVWCFFDSFDEECDTGAVI